MKIYLDYVFFINFLFDFILLLGISTLLKRNIKLKRIIIGSLFGGLSIFIMFLSIPSFLYFIIKMLFGVIMIIITFKYKNIKYTLINFAYLMILSIILGGALYLISIEIGYEHIGMIFFTNGKNLNIIILLLLACLITIIYVSLLKKYKRESFLKYKVDIYYKNEIIKLNGYLDTGNKLYDPYFSKPIIIINKDILHPTNYIYVPINTINGSSVLKCIKVEKIFISSIGFKYNVLVGLSNDKFCIPDIDIILHIDLLEGQNEDIIMDKKTI